METDIPHTARPTLDAWQSNWKHLRVPFQLTLAPIFLWGALLSGALPSARLAFAFVVFHFLLYTGITAYNSFYDRDEGPIGGLERPPDLRGSLLPVSLALKLAGFVLALPLGAAFAAIYAIFVVLSVLYSHPRTRWKASPLFSTLVVCVGQGMLGFLAGWSAACGGLGAIQSEAGVLGTLSAGFTTLGMYPITQVYQIEEDARRGDRTLSVLLGPDGALRFSQVAFLAAGAVAVPLCRHLFGVLDAVILVAAYGGIFAAIGRLRSRLGTMNRGTAFRAVMRFVYGGSAAFAAFILVEWLRR